jgi:putative colanic acid biosynthesis UDP-glucose lipid carrier transferase
MLKSAKTPVMENVILKNSSRLEIGMRAADIGLIWTAGQIAADARFSTLLHGAPLPHSTLVYLTCVLAFLMFPQFNLYASWRGRSIKFMLTHIFYSWTGVVALGVMVSFLAHQIGALSRLWLFIWYVTCLFSLILLRIAIHLILRKLRNKGMNAKKVVIIGYGLAGREMHRRALEQNWYGYEVIAIHTDSDNARVQLDPTIERLENLEGIQEYVLQKKINEIWITLPLSSSSQLLRLQFLLRNALVDIKWMPDMSDMQLLSTKMIAFLGLPVYDLNRPAADDMRGIMKDLFDKVFSIICLVLLAPAFAIISTIIKLTSKGPIIFRQPRMGLNGKTFNVYKFRTMYVHLEENSVTQATCNDKRVTPIGKFLRRTSLDELPQFINVLKGDMSVVGPRPHALPHNDIYKEKLVMYMLRHRVKPGITGWAQINGCRGETDTVEKMARRVEYDLHYIQNWSFWMDLKIVTWTAFKGWTGVNAY